MSTKQNFKINEEITADPVRLLDKEGNQVGVVSLSQAREYASKEDLDLVLVAGQADPPVVKTIEFEKFKYALEKKEKEARKHTRETQLKEVRLTPFISDHDFETILERAKEFLRRGDLVKVTIKFTGRQMAHTEFGFSLSKRVLEFLKNGGEIFREPKMEGRRLTFIVAPHKGEKKENAES